MTVFKFHKRYNNTIITYLPNIKNYNDRVEQIKSVSDYNGSLAIIIITNSIQDTFIDLNQPQNFSVKTIPYPKIIRGRILDILILFTLHRSRNIILVDWFKNFLCTSFLFKKRKDLTLIFSPVISDYYWFKKLPSLKGMWFDLRYHRLRAKGILKELLILRNCDRVLVQSYKLKKVYTQHYKIEPRKIHVNYNNFKLPESPTIHNFKTRINVGFLGNIEQHKGISIILEMIKNDKENLYFIAGKASGKKNKKILDKMLNFKNVHFLGFLNDNQKQTFFQDIDILLLPSYHEGSPRVVGEFLKFNKPIISTQIEGLDYCMNQKHIRLLPLNSTPQTYIDEINKYKKKTVEIYHNIDSNLQCEILKI